MLTRGRRNELLEMLGSEDLQWKTHFQAESARSTRSSARTPSWGRRRTAFGEATERDIEDINLALVEREPVTLILSEKGWIRAMRGHISDLSGLNFKDGDKLKFWVHAETTDKLLLMGGPVAAFFTLQGGQNCLVVAGHGEPIRGAR